MINYAAPKRIATEAFSYRGLILGFFLFAGTFKAALNLPVDLTVALAALVALSCTAELMRSKSVPSSVFLMTGLWAVLMFGAGLANGGYGLEKTSRFYTLTFLAAVAPPILIRDTHDLRRFFNVLILIAGLVSLNALSNLGQLGQNARLTAFDSNTIALGRGSGMGVLLVVGLWLSGAMSGGLSILLLLPLAFTLVASGSRGPLFAVILACLPLLWDALGRKSGLLRTGALLALSAGLGVLAAPFFPGLALARIDTLLGGDLDRSASVRAEALTYTPAQIGSHPLGVGFGGFADHVVLSPTPEPIIYPHSVFLEVGLEGGWLPLAVLVGLLLLGFWRSGIAIREGHVTGRLTVALLIFALFNSSVSGDLNDNKLLWAALVLALTVHALPRSEASEVRDQPVS